MYRTHIGTCRARFDSDCARLTVDGQLHGYGIDTRRTGNGSAGRFAIHRAAGAAFPSLAHFGLARATSAALIPSNASPYPTPSSMMRRSFWVSAMRVYLVVSGGSFASPSAISRARASSLSAGTISLTTPHSL